MTELGHNSNDQLRSIIDRIERLSDERDAISADIRDVYAESKGNGYDVPALRAIVRARREDAEKRREREANIELYRDALGIA